MNTTFGEYIRLLRTEKGMTLTQLAAKLGLDSANLSKIENGKRKFDEKRLKSLSSALGVKLDVIKSEYVSDFIATKLYQANCNKETLILAEKKVQYLKKKHSKKIKQT